YRIRKTAPLHGSHVFQGIKTIKKFSQDIIRANNLTTLLCSIECNCQLQSIDKLLLKPHYKAKLSRPHVS
ncbi:hypothetical protein DPMN_002992, partial [Dreissena polymorpha]